MYCGKTLLCTYITLNGGKGMSYPVKDFQHLLGTEGFSDKLLKNHFTLYQGYVRNYNKLKSTLEEMAAAGKQETAEYSELKRRLSWEFDGMRLHELYFENMGGSGRLQGKGCLAQSLTEHFGSVEAWEEDFMATASMRGIGWAVLYKDKQTGNLTNFGIDEHHIGHPVNGTPLLVLDAWEHAYMVDYSLNRADYINTFFNTIDWNVVEKRITD